MLETLYILMLGLTFGSFFGVVISRRRSLDSSVLGRSYCAKCKHTLRFYDLIPVLSWLLLKGKCRYCKQSISIFYPLIEILTSLLFYLCFLKIGIHPTLLVYLVITSCLIILSFIDYAFLIIPDSTIILLFCCGIILLITTPNLLLDKLLGSIIISIPFFILAFITKSIGYGDIKLLAAAGFILGTQKIIGATLFGNTFAGLVALYKVLIKKESPKAIMPLGPYLSIGIFIHLLWGSELISWYLS